MFYHSSQKICLVFTTDFVASLFAFKDNKVGIYLLDGLID